MNPIAIACWGAFLGCAAVAVIVFILAFARSARRVAFSGGVTALLSAAYALVFLGWVPVADGEVLQRLQALTAIVSAGVLAMLLFVLLGTFRQPAWRKAAPRSVGAATVLAFAISSALPAAHALQFAVGAAALTAAGALVASIASARRGERVGWLALAALPCVLIGMTGLDWYAYHPQSMPWQLLAASAVASVGYLLCIATAMWTRYAYMLEVRKVMTQGPNYDPVSGMRSYASGAAAAEIFPGADARPIGIVAISIGNLKMLEELHGRAAYNHAIFVCATRLRSLNLPGAELGRLQDDGFLIITRRPESGQQLIEQARQALKRLLRPVLLGTGREFEDIEVEGAIWEPALGIGVLMEAGDVRLEFALAGARDISRAAWAYSSCMGWYDEAAGAIEQIPLTD
jgi:GGDEF domain-containing protein